MKKKTLSLDALKVKSFVTSFDNKNENTVRGGKSGESAAICPKGIPEESGAGDNTNTNFITQNRCTRQGIYCD